ncbi:MAG: hypothetical protein KIH01_04065 [Candidatus Freyarchaeota archaeon]|nr:hypothetical protein [Candidatus Jordarchaeia archaeon]
MISIFVGTGGGFLVMVALKVGCSLGEDNLEDFLKLVELNVGSTPLSAIAIIDLKFRIWAMKGKLDDVLKKYENVPLHEMKTGEKIYDNDSFLMKVTDKLFVLAAVKNPLLVKVAVANLQGRINALSSLYILDKLIEET